MANRKLLNQPGRTIRITPAGALANGYRFVKEDTDPNSVVYAGVGDYAAGVIYHDYKAAETGDMVVTGIALVEASGTLTEGDWVAAGANGVAVKATTKAHKIRGRCVSAAGNGDLCSVDLDATPSPDVYDGLSEATGAETKGTSVAMVGGSVTITTTAVKANSVILVSRHTLGTAAGHLKVTTRTANTSFVIESSDATETSTIDWAIL